MESNHWRSMSIDELWDLRQKLSDILSEKIAAEKTKLEDRLREIELRYGKQVNRRID
jgi:DNA-binding protein H-NS